MRSAIEVPLGYPASTIFIDESQARSPNGRFFAVAAVKVRKPGHMARQLHAIRDRRGFPKGEFKFKAVTDGSLLVYYDAVDLLNAADAQVHACVVDKEVYNPFGRGRPFWRVHADIVSQLLVGCINKQELVSVLIDRISVPESFAYDEYVRARVNERLGATAVISCVSLDSRSTDMLQLADLAAGSIAYDRGLQVATYHPRQQDKKRVANRLKAALGCADFADGRNGRVNIATYRPRRPRSRPATRRLSVVEGAAG